MKTTVTMTGMTEALRMLESLPYELVTKRGGPVKLALKKGAMLIRDEEKQRLRALLNEQGTNETSGLLVDNIIASRGKKPADGNGERYVVRVRRKIYPPKQGEKESRSTIKIAQIFEYGSKHQRARPFIRPAFEATAQKAIEVIREDLLKRIDKVVNKLGTQVE